MRTRRGMVSVVAVLALCAAPVVASGSASASPADSVALRAAGLQQAPKSTLRVSPASAIAGESVRLTGRVPSAKTRRAVVLQASANGRRWKTLKRARTTRTGKFTIALAAPKASTRFRVSAPAVKVKKKRQPKALTPARGFTVLAQRLALTSDVKSVQVGRKVTLTGTASPARAGRAVVLQELVAGKWTQVAATVQSASGKVSFSRLLAKPGTVTYRAVTRAARGASSVTSKTYAIQVTLAPAPPPVITTASLPNAEIDSEYSALLETKDGRAGTWSEASGSLPAGLELAGNGRIGGTPTGTPATTDFTVRFTDSKSQSATRALSITTVLPVIPEVCLEQDSITATDCAALVAITDANPGRLPTWGADDPCGWTGVGCGSGEVTYLSLYGKGLTGLPNSVGNLNSLTSLEIGGNQLTSLPTTLGNLTQLTTLRLAENQLTSLPPSIGNLSQLTTLTLSQNQLESLPSGIGSLTQLTALDLTENQLTSLPAQIGNLSQVTALSLDQNFLTSIPAAVFDLTALTQLSLHGNQLTSLSPEISSLTNLEYLGISQNQLASLPTEIGDLSVLTNLDLHENQLTSLPAGVGNLGSLQQLNLSDNRLAGNIAQWAESLSLNDTLTGLWLSPNGCMNAGGNTALEDWLAWHDPAWRSGCP